MYDQAREDTFYIILYSMVTAMATMLQDRKRPLWPVAVMFAPLAVGNALCVATLSYDFLPLYVCFFLSTICASSISSVSIKRLSIPSVPSLPSS